MLGPPCRSTIYEPPSDDLLEALTELVKYATVADSGAKRTPAQGGAPWLPAIQLHTLLPPALAAQRGGGAAAAVPHIAAGPAKLGAAAAPAAQALARRLYRFFRRALALWPEQRSIKPLLRCFLAYVAPWRTSSAAPMLLPGAAAAAPGHSALASHLTAQVSDLVHRVHWADGGRGDSGRCERARGRLQWMQSRHCSHLAAWSHARPAAARPSTARSYGPQWEAHVLANLPFYLALLPLFLEASVARVEVGGRSGGEVAGLCHGRWADGWAEGPPGTARTAAAAASEQMPR